MTKNEPKTRNKTVLQGRMISALVTEDLYDMVRVQHNWRWREIIEMGVQAKKNMPHVLDRLNEVEGSSTEKDQKIAKMSGIIQQLSLRVWEMEQGMKKVRL